MKMRMAAACAVLALGCFGSGGSDGGSGGAGGTSGGTGAGGQSMSGGSGPMGGTGSTSCGVCSVPACAPGQTPETAPGDCCPSCGLVGTAGSAGMGAGTTGSAGTGGAAGAGGGACCPCPDQPQPAGCFECDLFCPGGTAGTSGTGTPCGANGACPSNEECCIQPGGNYCVAVGTCVPAKCASPDTPIATPTGERPIAELREGDLVLSVDRGAVVAVPIVATGRRAVSDHAVVRVVLSSGAVIEISAGHPTADGRTLGALAPGDRLGDAEVASVSMVPYAHAFTYDILPASDTGAYFAAGALVGSTLVVGSDGRTAR